MICAGHVPLYRERVNKDVEPFLRYFLPRGAAFNRTMAFQIVRQLHLTFKAMSADEMYDVLMEQLVLDVNKYDPGYAEKVRVTAGKIDEVCGDEDSFSAAGLNEHLEFDCDRYLRLPGRRPQAFSRVGPLGSRITFRPGSGHSRPPGVVLPQPREFASADVEVFRSRSAARWPLAHCRYRRQARARSHRSRSRMGDCACPPVACSSRYLLGPAVSLHGQGRPDHGFFSDAAGRL